LALYTNTGGDTLSPPFYLKEKSMSIQDDHFDLEAYFKSLVEGAKKGSPERKAAKAAKEAYARVWEAFVDEENENAKLRPVVYAATTIVQHVIETHYNRPGEG